METGSQRARGDAITRRRSPTKCELGMVVAAVHENVETGREHVLDHDVVPAGPGAPSEQRPVGGIEWARFALDGDENGRAGLRAPAQRPGSPFVNQLRDPGHAAME